MSLTPEARDSTTTQWRYITRFPTYLAIKNPTNIVYYAILAGLQDRHFILSRDDFLAREGALDYIGQRGYAGQGDYGSQG